MANMAKRLDQPGVNALVLFNRFYSWRLSSQSSAESDKPCRAAATEGGLDARYAAGSILRTNVHGGHPGRSPVTSITAAAI